MTILLRPLRLTLHVNACAVMWIERCDVISAAVGLDQLQPRLFPCTECSRSRIFPMHRAGEAPSVGLTEHLQLLGFETGRLKTGTPARVDRTTVDFSVMEEQPGHDPVSWFSFDPSWHVPREQMSCYLTHTNEATHQLIRDNLHESPQYGGWVDSVGPRYCPSIEDKIVRFKDKERHQIFIEPEGRHTPELYIQGFSTGLPERLQLAMLQTLRGLEECRCCLASLLLQPLQQLLSLWGMVHPS
jgi:glucose-inhibited division protein A